MTIVLALRQKHNQEIDSIRQVQKEDKLEKKTAEVTELHESIDQLKVSCLYKHPQAIRQLLKHELFHALFHHKYSVKASAHQTQQTILVNGVNRSFLLVVYHIMLLCCLSCLVCRSF